MIFDPLKEGKRETYFKMIETILPRPIAWVSTVSSEGTRNLAPFSFFTGVTSTPPTLLFCCGNKRGGIPKDTAQNCIDTGEFVVNVVVGAQCEEMVVTSAALDAHVDEFEAAGLDAIDSHLIGVPRVKGAPISFECTCREIIEIKDDQGRITSRIIIGNILLIHVDDGVLAEDGTVDTDRLDIVGRIGGQSYAKLAQPFVVERPKRPG